MTDRDFVSWDLLFVVVDTGRALFVEEVLLDK
jgi:hypothetical protein